MVGGGRVGAPWDIYRFATKSSPNVAVSGIIGVSRDIYRFTTKSSPKAAVSGIVGAGICMVWDPCTYRRQRFFARERKYRNGEILLLAVSKILYLPR